MNTIDMDTSYSMYVSEVLEASQEYLNNHVRGKGKRVRKASDLEGAAKRLNVSKHKDRQFVDYLAVVKKTQKAKFYSIEEGLMGLYGFWVPNSMVLDTKVGKLALKKGFKIKVIEYIS